MCFKRKEVRKLRLSITFTTYFLYIFIYCSEYLIKIDNEKISYEILIDLNSELITDTEVAVFFKRSCVCVSLYIYFI